MSHVIEVPCPWGSNNCVFCLAVMLRASVVGWNLPTWCFLANSLLCWWTEQVPLLRLLSSLQAVTRDTGTVVEIGLVVLLTVLALGFLPLCSRLDLCYISSLPDTTSSHTSLEVVPLCFR